VPPAPSGVLRLSAAEARRAAVAGQLLADPGPRSIAEVIAQLGWLQIDPTAVVERTERLVLFSRLGAYDPAELDRLLAARELFEYRAFILPRSDYALHRPSMRRYLSGTRSRPVYIRGWLAENRAFRDYVLRRLREDGPLPTSAIEDRARTPWTTGGWNDGKSVPMMLESLHRIGRVMVVGRDGRERLWDVAERVVPVDDRLPDAEVARRLVDGQLRAFGVARARELGIAFDGPSPGRDAALRRLTREGRIRQVAIDGMDGTWYAHPDALAAPYAPRVTVLSPFDRLIHDRARTTALFRFDYRLEIYVPKAKRVHGYYVLPVLDGDRLVGRIDPVFDRAAGVLHIQAAFLQPGGAPDVVVRAATDLAAWLGAARVAYAAPAAAVLGTRAT